MAIILPQPTSIQLGDGDLFVMHGDCDCRYHHWIPEESNATGTRISLTFRQHLPTYVGVNPAPVAVYHRTMATGKALSPEKLNHDRDVVRADDLVKSAQSSIDKTVAALQKLVKELKGVMQVHERANLTDVINRIERERQYLTYLRRNRLAKAADRAREHLRQGVDSERNAT